MREQNYSRYGSEKNGARMMQENGIGELHIGVTISDHQWEGIQRFLPSANQTGRPRSDDRPALQGILYVLLHGCRWHDIPHEYGSPITAWRRFKDWREAGIWENIWDHLLRTFTEEQRRQWSQALLHGAFIPTKKREKRIIL